MKYLDEKDYTISENEIIKYLKDNFEKIPNSVLKFVNYNEDRTEIIVKGTVEEWKQLFKNFGLD